MKYQQQVNSLPGALGPNTEAYWLNTTTTTGAPYSLGAQPLYFSPSLGKYVTSFDNMSSVDFSSFGKRRKRKSTTRTSRKRTSRKRKSTSRKRTSKRCRCCSKCKMIISRRKTGPRCKCCTRCNVRKYSKRA